MDCLNAVFSWSMAALARGRAPECRHDGTPWTEKDSQTRFQGELGCTAALLQCRGDWEWVCQSMRFRHYGAEFFCWLCDATHIGPNTYLNVAPTAPWRGSLWTHETYEWANQLPL